MWGKEEKERDRKEKKKEGDKEKELVCILNQVVLEAFM